MIVLEGVEAGRDPAKEQALVAAALRCFARWGVAKTSLDDIAREAGVSRATVYRAFAGGKDALVEAVARTEIGSFFDGLRAVLEGAGDLEECLVGAMAYASRSIREHQALQFLFAHEPGLVLPHLAFARMDGVLAGVSSFAAPALERWLAPEDARRVGEWATRLVVSFSICPSDTVDLTDEVAVRRLVRTFVLPGVSTAVPA